MAQVIWKESALNDLQDILAYYAKDSLVYAERLRARLMDAPRLLEHSPLMGRVVPEFRQQDIRELIVRPYRLIYVVRGDTCYVAAIIHGSRDLAQWVDPEGLRDGGAPEVGAG